MNDINRKNQKGQPRHQAGQAVLIVLLSLSVVLIIVLFIMSRSITDISLSIKDENSLRAFSAAEAGVERALVLSGDVQSGIIGDANFSANVSSFASNASSVVYPISLKSGENAIFWFKRTGEATIFTGNSFKLCWADRGTDANTATTPAVEITVFYTTVLNDLSTLRVFRTTLDPNSARRVNNRFTAPTISNCLIDGENFAFQSSISLVGISNLEYGTVKVLYNTVVAHKVGIDVNGTGSTLPSQGKKIESDGSYGDANRAIQVYQLNPEVPPIFANAIFNSSGIIK